MIKKTRHPKDRGERRLVSKKKVHSNASPVFKLLKEREQLQALDTITHNELDLVITTQEGKIT